MSYTQAGKNITGQFGMPLYGIQSGELPPFAGNAFWVDGTNGSDGNTGGPQDPLKTLKQAHSLCTAGNNDVVYFWNQCNQTATLVWSKNNTHLIGLSQGYFNSDAALIGLASYTATSGAFTPLVNVTATGCIFQNVAAGSGINQAATQVCWAEAGGYNTYINCHFAQTGHATAAAQAGNRALTLASVKNSFINCVIGGDTIVRATGTNYTMECLAGSGSSIFRGCVFAMWSSVAASAQINAAATTGTGYLLLDDCQFINDMGNAGATASTLPLTISATAGFVVLITPATVFLGVAGKAATTGQLVYISGAPPATLGNIASSTT
jgi:hypothetical protein